VKNASMTFSNRILKDQCGKPCTSLKMFGGQFLTLGFLNGITRSGSMGMISALFSLRVKRFVLSIL